MTHELSDALNLEELEYKPEHELVKHINSMPGGKWKAKVYPQFLGKKLSHLHRLGGQRPVPKYKALRKQVTKY